MENTDLVMKVLFDQVHDRLIRIESKLDEVGEFKTKTLVSARLTAVVVSGIMGFLSLVSSGILVYLITSKLSK